MWFERKMGYTTPAQRQRRKFRRRAYLIAGAGALAFLAAMLFVDGCIHFDVCVEGLMK